MISAKVINRGLQFDALLNFVQDDRFLTAALIESAEPIAAAARVNIAKRTGQTAAQITIWVIRDGGLVRVLVGIPGTDILGRASRAYIGGFLERGTSRFSAKPWLRPALDAEGGDRLTARLAAIAREKLSRAA